MNEYEVKLRAVIDWCHSCEWSVVDFAMLFRRMQLVIEYRRMWQLATDSEQTEFWAWSRDDALEKLDEFMRARCYPADIRLAVHWLVSHGRNGIPFK